MKGLTEDRPVVGEWRAPSNDGWREMRFQHGEPSVAEPLSIPVDIRVRVCAPDELHEYSGALDHEIACPCVFVSREQLYQLSSRLRFWLGLSSWREEDGFRFALTESPEVVIALGPRPGLITRPDLPAWTLSYRSANFSFESSFVVDPSCVACALEGLERLLGPE